MYFIQARVSENRGHCLKEDNPLSKHAISEIVCTTTAHSMASYHFKLYIVDDLVLMCESLHWFKSVFTSNLVATVCTFMFVFIYL